MNPVQKGLIALIRSALTGKAYPLPADFSLAQAGDIARSHQVVGLAYEGALLCGIPRQDPAMERLFRLYCQGHFRSNRQMAAINTLTAAFEEAGIDYLPVKGWVLKALYPKAAMRPMADADILIRDAQKDRIAPLMTGLGYREKSVYDYEWTWQSRELTAELHTRLMPSFPIGGFRYAFDGWEHAAVTRGHRYDLIPEEAYIYLFAHFVKHYRGRGIGLRQLIDLWVFRRANPAMDEDRIARRMTQMGLNEFYGNTCRLLENWFADGPADEKTQCIARHIFAGGSWGTEEQAAFAAGVRDTGDTRAPAKSRRRALRLRIFLPYIHMQNRYPVLRKCPWLLPVFWPVRWAETLLFRREKIKEFRAQKAALTDENIETYRKSMEVVGLR